MVEEGGKAVGKFAGQKLNDVLNSKPVQSITQAVPMAEPLLKKIPKVIDQKVIDAEVEKLRKRLAQMGDDGESGAGLKKKGKKKIMDYL